MREMKGALYSLFFPPVCQAEKHKKKHTDDEDRILITGQGQV